MGHAAKTSQTKYGHKVDQYVDMRSMFDRNAIDVNSVTLGSWLDVDTKSEQFQDHRTANELVHCFYRQPFVVPNVSG